MMLRKSFLMMVFSLSSLLLLIPIPNSYAASVSVFSTNFNAGAPGQFSGITTTESVQGYNGVGGFAGNFLRNTDATAPIQAKTTLTLNNLVCHTSIDVNFDLAVMDTWDGFGSATFADGSPTGPDALAVTADGNQVFNQVFAIGQGTQTYENPPTGIKIGATVQRGFHPDWPDAAYAMNLEPAFHGISHTSTSLKIDWFASSPGWEGGTDPVFPNESWGIDNVEVVLNGIDDPSCIQHPQVGGELLSVNTSALLLAGVQSTTWLIPVVLSIAGIGIFVISRKSE